MKFFYMVISHYNNHTTNNTLFKKIESHEKVIPIYELGNAYIIRELAATALYTLPSVQGNFLMLPNTEGEESEINLELLFGAVLAEPGKIAEMFHTKTNE